MTSASCCSGAGSCLLLSASRSLSTMAITQLRHLATLAHTLSWGGDNTTNNRVTSASLIPLVWGSKMEGSQITKNKEQETQQKMSRCSKDQREKKGCMDYAQSISFVSCIPFLYSGFQFLMIHSAFLCAWVFVFQISVFSWIS